ncbi:hypothetical protein Tdes44962_MAKER08307 [Teratosphaeria destructans]|uniref:Uncharacterized protein n=1 Tax=Teratosphaeria destructans TaxID=418781 RepID=A0A9W7SX51_9PEZI|nr:hypothetical protein Tdes44962_MAKER08307 [Teratosphaeria destructans]
MPSIPRKPQCEDSKNFDPDTYFAKWATEFQPPYDNDLRKFIITTFGLDSNDDYGYMAQQAEVTLLHAQAVVDMGGQGNLHAWYFDSEGKRRLPAPTAADIKAYTDVFRPTTSTQKALVQVESNAKRASIRLDVGQHLMSKYHPPTPEEKLVVSKHKAHTNPYFDIWAWTCQNLEWGGPEEGTVKVRHSHAVLPILYHHFGCICPSYESLELIRQLAKGRRIVDLGSGNGYWTYMLRRMEPPSKKVNKLEVLPVDNGMSEWRVMWVGDTIEADGEKWLLQNRGAESDVLLLVYPMVGTEFTSRMIRAYRGTTIICAGAQNTSGFTAFAKETIADWMAREMTGWEKVLQIPLPSFAAKDEALFVFEKRDSA